MAKPRKIRVDFRKNRSVRRRDGDLTRSLGDDPDALADMASRERVSGKGDLTRKRTVRLDDDLPGAAAWTAAASACPCSPPWPTPMSIGSRPPCPGPSASPDSPGRRRLRGQGRLRPIEATGAPE